VELWFAICKSAALAIIVDPIVSDDDRPAVDCSQFAKCRAHPVITVDSNARRNAIAVGAIKARRRFVDLQSRCVGIGAEVGKCGRWSQYF
jgi:hypothetical protein